jgi:hypothetical protein
MDPRLSNFLWRAIPGGGLCIAMGLYARKRTQSHAVVGAAALGAGAAGVVLGGWAQILAGRAQGMLPASTETALAGGAAAQPSLTPKQVEEAVAKQQAQGETVRPVSLEEVGDNVISINKSALDESALGSTGSE